MSSSRARWYHKIDTPQKIKSIVRNAVELVPPTAFMIIQQKARFVNSSFYTIFCQKFRQKRYTIEKTFTSRYFFCSILTNRKTKRKIRIEGRKERA